MNFVHSKSQECTKSELDLFSVPPTQISLEKVHWVDHQPVSSVADGGPITFLSPGTEDYMGREPGTEDYVETKRSG
jgi:hypothetical protein